MSVIIVRIWVGCNPPPSCCTVQCTVRCTVVYSRHLTTVQLLCFLSVSPSGRFLGERCHWEQVLWRSGERQEAGCVVGVVTWCWGGRSVLSTLSSCWSGPSSPRPASLSLWLSISTLGLLGTSSPSSPTSYWPLGWSASLSPSWPAVAPSYPASVSSSPSSSLSLVSSLEKLLWDFLFISR